MQSLAHIGQIASVGPIAHGEIENAHAVDRYAGRLPTFAARPHDAILPFFAAFFGAVFFARAISRFCFFRGAPSL